MQIKRVLLRFLIFGLMGLLLFLNLIGCVVATARSRNQLIVIGSLAIAAGSAQVFWTHSHTGTALTLFLMLTSAFYLAVALQFVRAFFCDGEPFCGDALAGAVAAYLLIGLVWASFMCSLSGIVRALSGFRSRMTRPILHGS